MRSPHFQKYTRTAIGEPATVDSEPGGRLAPVLMMATLSLLAFSTFCTIAGALLLGLSGLPPHLAILAGQAVFAIAMIVGCITFIYCMRNG